MCSFIVQSFKKIKFLAIAITLVLMNLSMVYASGNAESTGGMSDFFWKLINFFILVGIVWYFAKKPVEVGMASSADLCKQSWDYSKKDKERNEVDLANFKQKLADMEEEASEILKNAKIEAENEKSRIISEAQTQAEYIKTQVKFNVEQERKKVEFELRKWIATESVKLAESMIQEQMNERHDRILVKNYISNINQ